LEKNSSGGGGVGAVIPYDASTGTGMKGGLEGVLNPTEESRKRKICPRNIAIPKKRQGKKRIQKGGENRQREGLVSGE